MQLERHEVMELAAKYLEQDLRRGPAMQSPEATEKLLRCRLDQRKNEEFWVMFLDTRHRLIEFECLFTGTIDGATVYPRVIAQRALELNAAAVILAHNHPSGVAEPSMADQSITRRIKEALGLLDIRLLDHFVIGDRAMSMAERGMM